MIFRQTAICKFPTEKIMGAPNFNFAPKFFQNGGFRSQILPFGRKINDKKKIFRQYSDSPKFTWDNCPPPFCSDATGLIVVYKVLLREVDLKKTLISVVC